MKVTINNEVWLVKWQYETESNRRRTICKILNTANNAIGVGSASCDSREQFCKDKGRKISLANALRGLDRRTMRPSFWRAYECEMGFK